MPRAGNHASYRPMPRDFAEVFERVGWDAIREELRAHRITVTRWIREHDAAAAEAGTPLLRERRRAWLEQHYAAHHPGRKIRGWAPGRQRSRRYVMGQTLASVGQGVGLAVEAARKYLTISYFLAWIGGRVIRLAKYRLRMMAVKLRTPRRHNAPEPERTHGLSPHQ